MVAGLVVRAIVKSSKDEDRKSESQSSYYEARPVPHTLPSPTRLPQSGRPKKLSHQRVVEEWGNRPVPSKWPTWKEFQRAKERIQDPHHYLCHCGISGVVKSGKSSLLNSLRGLAPHDRGAAPVGASETTLEVQRYVDAPPPYPLALYDIPGAGTKSIPMNNYFNAQGLFALDCLVVVVKDSFQEHDATLISRCREQNIRTFIVRSHSDTHIRDVCEDNGDSPDDHEAFVDARKQYIRDAKSNLLQGLEDFGLSAEKVYLVNSRVMLRVVRGGNSKTLLENVPEDRLSLEQYLKHTYSQFTNCLPLGLNPNSIMVFHLLLLPLVSYAVKGTIDYFSKKKLQANPVLEKIVAARLPESGRHSSGIDERVIAEWGDRPVPEDWPSLSEIQNAKQRQEDPDHRLCHFGIAGVVNSGKSSLLNSVRGLRAKDKGAAPVGSSEKTREVTRYLDHPASPFAWYDIPGSGTASIPTSNYFNAQGLFALDCIIILVKDSFQEHDAALISRCAKLDIPTYIARSHSDSHIRDICVDNGEDPEDKDALLEARDTYIKEARANIENGLKGFGLPSQKVYLVNARSMHKIMSYSGEKSANVTESYTIDEGELWKDILEECLKRRLSK
ncbi:P-loop containing nucleoside triphosphate hydrolase protein [Flagelloscypha sp. PMI_526]|nr:P-loop containing nucleoside triphosphate hydrolase protein [Flagelloscypha sp. PMI_526]